MTGFDTLSPRRQQEHYTLPRKGHEQKRTGLDVNDLSHLVY